MCGLTAVVQLGDHPESKPKTDVEREIDNSLERVKHRGPDAQGRWISDDGRVGLGQVRLSIIDLSSQGDQPFHNTEDDVHAVVNGELYDHERYRAELSEEYSFQSNSDCELVLALYKRYGLSFADHLRGEFALIIYDAKRKVLIATRDRYGIKPLYWAIWQGRLLIATEMKSFLGYGWQPEWDVSSLRERGWTNDMRTMFKGVRKVQPGSSLFCRDFGDIEHKVYWDHVYPDKVTCASHMSSGSVSDNLQNVVQERSEEEMIQGVRDRLVEAVRLRLRADVPVAMCLSGGLDSSSLAGITNHLIKTEGVQLGSSGSQTLKCFTVQFEHDRTNDEAEIAQRTAKRLGMEWIPIHMDETAIASRLEDVAYHSEMYLGDVNAMGRLALAEEVHSQGIKVLLTGTNPHVSDDGYAWLEPERIKEPDPSWPALFDTDKEFQNAKKTQFAKAESLIADSARQISSSFMARMLAGDYVAGVMTSITELPFATWTDKYTSSPATTVLAESLPSHVYHKMQHHWHPLNTAMYIWNKTNFPNILLRYIGDSIDMVHHVESRTPFLDHHLTEYSMTIPPSLKMRLDPETNKIREKWILREAVKPFVTEEVYQRRKAPYLGPVEFSADGPLYKEIKRLVTREAVEKLGLFDWGVIDSMAEKAFGQHEHGAFRTVLAVAQLIVIGKRFGVRTAQPHMLNGQAS
ncbi:hypothetical protein PRZ48_009094 [Zasmidium cellare]|uniref:Glutamine amidotransferase type-2 domain-containing protein n=1 Tax=Zasmidium cellare TaxID=395010 RepID=A0ABR0EHC3_ZASCE|nr:hypothetical protein PRZ48_009094 [Zasmidium cellare]